MTYTADGNTILANGELFLTVHPTDSGGVTVEQQAKLVADALNDRFSDVVRHTKQGVPSNV